MCPSPGSCCAVPCPVATVSTFHLCWYAARHVPDDLSGRFGFVHPQFGKQEPADNPEIKKFAEGKGFMGPVFAKIDVNGPKGNHG